MRNRTFSLVTFLLSVFFLTTFAFAQKVDEKTKSNYIDPAVITALKGDWQNTLKSVLRIESIDSATGQIKGQYRTGVGADEKFHSLIGWVNTKVPASQKDSIATKDNEKNVVVLTFSVRWATPTTNWGSVSSWVGYYTLYDDGKPKIVGQWLLAKNNAEFIFDHISAGQDIFAKSNP